MEASDGDLWFCGERPKEDAEVGGARWGDAYHLHNEAALGSQQLHISAFVFTPSTPNP